MQTNRSGKFTDGLFYLFVMSVAAAIGLFTFENYPALKVFATFAWALFCIFYVTPWFYPVVTKKYTWKSENSILVAFDSGPISMERGYERDRQEFGLEPKNQKGKKTIWVYDHHLMGNDRHLDGLDVNMIWLNVGKIVAKLTDDGFLVSWEESTTPWNVVGEKKKVK